ncbi:MAG: lipid II flippase MurJ [Bdellovibrio sp.]
MKSKESITRSVMLSTGLRTLSRIVGMIRTILVASFFGATVSTDAFQVALGIIFFYFLFIESALELVTIPTLATLTDDPPRLKQAAWAFLVKLSIFCVFLLAALFISQNLILDFLVPANNPDLRSSTAKFIPMMALGAVIYIIYRYVCLVERAQKRFAPEIISDLFLSIALTVYIAFRHSDPIVLGESYLAANLAALIFMLWRSQTISWDFFKLKDRSLKTPGSFVLFISTGLISSAYLALEKKLGASAPLGTLTIYSFATVIFRFLSAYGSAVVQIFHPSFHDNDGKHRFMQLTKLMWLYSIPIAFAVILSSDLIVSILFSSKKMSSDQLQSMSTSIQILAIYLFTELTGNTLIRYTIAHGGIRIYNIVFSTVALISFSIAYAFRDTFGVQVLAMYNLLTNASLMICMTVILHKNYKILSLKDYSFLMKILSVALLAIAPSLIIDALYPIHAIVKTALFLAIFTTCYFRFVHDEINHLLLAKIDKLKNSLIQKYFRP